MKFSIKPVFVGWMTLIAQLPGQLFLTFWSAMFFGGMGTSFGLFPKDSPVPFFLCGAVAFILVPSVAYLGKKLNYARTEYKFFADRLEFEEGFFTINKKVVKFRDVKEVTLRKGILQRACGLGTIYLATLATGSGNRTNVFSAFGFGNVSASGIGIRDIEEPDVFYEKVRKLIDAENAG